MAHPQRRPPLANSLQASLRYTLTSGMRLGGDEATGQATRVRFPEVINPAGNPQQLKGWGRLGVLLRYN